MSMFPILMMFPIFMVMMEIVIISNKDCTPLSHKNES